MVREVGKGYPEQFAEIVNGSYGPLRELSNFVQNIK